ncbi:MAG: hypothetical protein Q4D58_12300 [Synergistaceae bacterium]|nr:hypothetical protein [Synergistaceae bacterium]
MKKIYEDDRGFRYRVEAGIGGQVFKARFIKPGKTTGHCVRMLPWRDSFDAAQKDLNLYAERKGMREVSNE